MQENAAEKTGRSGLQAYRILKASQIGTEIYKRTPEISKPASFSIRNGSGGVFGVTDETAIPTEQTKIHIS